MQDALGRVRGFVIVFLKQGTPNIVWSNGKQVLLFSIKMVYFEQLLTLGQKTLLILWTYLKNNNSVRFEQYNSNYAWFPL